MELSTQAQNRCAFSSQQYHLSMSYSVDTMVHFEVLLHISEDFDATGLVHRSFFIVCSTNWTDDVVIWIVGMLSAFLFNYFSVGGKKVLVLLFQSGFRIIEFLHLLLVLVQVWQSI